MTVLAPRYRPAARRTAAQDVIRTGPLAAGLVFYADLTRQGELSARDLVDTTRQSSGIIHPGMTPAGPGRYRTDGASNLLFTFRDRHKFASGPFTYAFYGCPDSIASAATIIGNLSSGVDAQARVLTNYDGAGANAGYLCLFTFNGSSTLVAAAGVITPERPKWYVTLRRQDGTLQIWSNGVLRGEASGTIRDVSGTHGNPIQMGYNVTNSTVRSLVAGAAWNRALQAAEIQEMARLGATALLPRVRRFMSVTAAAGPSFQPAWARNANTVLRAA